MLLTTLLLTGATVPSWPASDLLVEIVERQRQTIRFMPGLPAHGTISLGFAALEPGTDREAELDAAVSGDRFALGSGFATALDTNVTLEFGRRKLKPGRYYPLIEKDDDDWLVVFVDEVAARKVGWDGSGVHPEVEGMRVALEVTDPPPKKPKHHLYVAEAAPGSKALRFNIWYGDRYLRVPLEADVKNGLPRATLTKRSRCTVFEPAPSDDQPRRDRLSIEYGRLKWNESFEPRFADFGRGDRWSAGSLFWTNLVTTGDCVIGSERLEAGHYSLVLERGRTEDDWSLAVATSSERRKRKADPTMAEALRKVERVDVAYEQVDDPVDVISIQFLPETNPNELEIRWGPHRWSAPLLFDDPDVR